jgi:hypothetical protein
MEISYGRIGVLRRQIDNHKPDGQIEGHNVQEADCSAGFSHGLLELCT